MTSRFTVVRIVLGSALLVTAGLKLYGLSVSAIPRVGWFAQPWVQLAAAEWEIVLGIWLLSGAYPRLSWLAALGTFAAFAAVSGYLGWVGVASCGCFGVVKASPWWAFGVDVAALGLLSVTRPDYGKVESLVPIGSGFAVIVVMGMVGFAIATGIGVAVYGTPQAALARLKGELVVVSPSYLDLGTGQRGTSLESAVSVTNWTDEPIRLIGGTYDCSCITADLPLTIPPGESREVTVRMTIPNSARGTLTKRAEFTTDYSRQRNLQFVVNCRAVE